MTDVVLVSAARSSVLTHCVWVGRDSRACEVRQYENIVAVAATTAIKPFTLIRDVVMQFTL